MKTLTLVLVCALPLAAQGSGAKSDSIRAAAVVARHREAIGGSSAVGSNKEMHMVVTMSMPTPGAPEVRTESYMKAPNLLYMKTNMPGIGLMEMGFDGKTPWSMSALTGPTIHEEVPKQMTDALNFDGLAFAGATMRYVGQRQMGGRTFDVLRVTLPDSTAQTQYFDVKTGLLAGMDTDGAAPPPAGRMHMSFDEYKRFGKVLQAVKTTVVSPTGEEFVMTTVSFDNGPLDSKVFELPPAVRQLRDSLSKGRKP